MEFPEFSQQNIRLGVFAGVFLLMTLLEFCLPKKERVEPRHKRWFTNLGLVVVDSIALRLLFPILAVGMAEIATQKGWGLFSLTDFPYWFEVLLAAVLLDGAIYSQHVASHKIPMLWRFHKVHHADRDIDASTGIRFHPVEIVLSMLYKFALVCLLGAPALGVFIFEVVLNGSAMFNHANLRLPLWLDKIIRVVFVTPDMHRVHHSIIHRETDSNYGFNLSIWDKLFGTYIDQPEKGHAEMTIGLKEYQTSKPSSLIWSLLLPFRK